MKDFLTKWRFLQVCTLIICLLMCQASAGIFWTLPVGNQGNPIVVYLAPACPHCLQTLQEIKKYVEQKNGGIMIKLVATGLKDIFVMNLLGLKANNPAEFFEALLTYATKDENAQISSEDRNQIEKSEASPDVKEVQLSLLAKGIPLEAIFASTPDNENPLDNRNKEELGKIIQEVNNFNAGIKEVNLPIFIRNEKKHETLAKAAETG